MASGHIPSWQIDGETVADFIFLGSKITADDEVVTLLSLAILREIPLTFRIKIFLVF